jgi:hypothetical protein
MIKKSFSERLMTGFEASEEPDAQQKSEPKLYSGPLDV